MLLGHATDLREVADCYRRVARIHASLNPVSDQIFLLMAASATLKACWAELSGAGGMAWAFPGMASHWIVWPPVLLGRKGRARLRTCTASTWMTAPQWNQSLRQGLNPPDQESAMKKLVRAQAGVKLERIERLAGRQKEVSFRLSTHRTGQPRIIIGEDEAQRAFAREVAASLEDTVVQGLIEQGAFDH